MVALLSPAYLSSAMCLEEFSIAQLQHQAKNYTGTLIPIIVAPLVNDDGICEDVPANIAETKSQWIVSG